MRHRRPADISRRMQQGDVAEVSQLATLLGVSPATVLRDLEAFCHADEIGRERRTAVPLPESMPESLDEAPPEPEPAVPVRPEIGDDPFDDMACIRAAAKGAVARRAAELGVDGEVVVTDICTTAGRLARHLRRRRLTVVTVVTASLAVVDELRDGPESSWSCSAQSCAAHSCRSSAASLSTLSAGCAQRAPSSAASGITRDGSVLDTTLAEVSVKRAMMAAARSTVPVVDAAKFSGRGVLGVGGLDTIDMLVTDDEADPDTLSSCLLEGTEVITT